MADETREERLADESVPAAEGAAEALTEQKPKGLKGLIAYIKAHENLRQMVMFVLFSFICGASQFVLTYGLSLLRYTGGTMAEPFAGWKVSEGFSVFGYDSTAEFIGFLVGSVTGQVLTFVLNRKSTFRINDHIAFRAVAYAILAILIILMQTFLGGVITKACWDAKPEADGFLAFLFNMAGLVTGGIAAVIINFLGNKFFVMRKWKSKAAPAEEAEAPAADDATDAE